MTKQAIHTDEAVNVRRFVRGVGWSARVVQRLDTMPFGAVFSRAFDGGRYGLGGYQFQVWRACGMAFLRVSPPRSQVTWWRLEFTG